METWGDTIKLWADDANVDEEIIDICDVNNLQHVLDLLAEWAKLWQLKLTLSKCFLLNIGKIPASAFL